jgi:hypothetical protein
MILPPEANDWVQNSGIPQPPRGSGQSTFVDFDPDVAITWPEPGGYIGGQVEIRGNARSGDFRNYRIEFGPGLEPSSWTQIGPEHGNQVENGVLEFLDTTTLAEGLYTLRLSVQQGDGSVRQWNTQVTIDNTPPSVVISYPRPDQLYVIEDDEQVNVNAVANDTWAMARVEFFRNGEAYAQSTVAPYNERWKIAMQNVAVDGTGAENWLGIASDDTDITPGRIRNFDNGFAGVITGNGTYLESHLFKVVAYDRAGNKAESEEVRIYVRNKKTN